MDKKKIAEAYILGISFGLFGAHHFYLGRKGFGILYACTLGLFGCGYIYDLIRMRLLVKHVNKYGTKVKLVSDGYLFWAFGGIFGAHHFYLGNKKLGILYACTLGAFTIGWIADVFRMKNLVKASNDPASDYGFTKYTAFILCVSPPLGILGAHHFYLKRYWNGGFYVATLGLFGFGWFFDMFRFQVLHERFADEDKHKYPDEAYLYWFPFGIFGLHHFYLQRKSWGLLHACTVGFLGIGWIIDGIRLRKLIKEYNKRIEDPYLNNFRICTSSRAANKKNSKLRITSGAANETNSELRITKRDKFKIKNTGQDPNDTCTTGLMASNHRTALAYKDSDNHPSDKNLPRDDRNIADDHKNLQNASDEIL